MNPEQIEKFKAVCEDIGSSDKGIHHLCKVHKLRYPTFYECLKDEELCNIYMRARDCQADYLADQIIEISDNNSKDETPFVGKNHIDRDKLRVEARKWIAAKLKPRKYGDKIETETKLTISNAPDWLKGDITKTT